ncbi:MAG: ABC transporter ATP-binding protein/permease [Acidobacteriia bacterium]|nr:ABC transporter ATP-binding protein/permease [Terriglobia bacterium]
MLRYAFQTIIWPRRKLVLVGLVLIIINRIASLALPGSTKYLMDNVIAKGDIELLNMLLLGVATALLIQAGSSFALTRLLSVEAQHLISLLRVNVQKHVLYLPVRYFDNTKSGELVSRIMTDVEGIRNLVGTGLVQMFGGVLTSCIAFVILIKLNAILTLYVLVPLLFFGLISLKAFSYIRPIFRQRGKINAEVTGRLTESLGGIRVIKGFNAEQSEIKVFENGVARIFENVKRSLTATSLVTSSGTLLIGLATIGIIWFGSGEIINGSMTIGDLVAFISFLALLVTPMVQMGNIGSQFTEAFAGLDRTNELLSLSEENEDVKRSIKLSDCKGHLTFCDVSFGYEKNVKVLKNISFDAPEGSVTALVGSSGSGKTTIAGLAATFLTPDEGTIKIDGVDLSTVTLDSYRSQLGVVLQDDFLYDGTIRENILFSKSTTDETKLLEAIKASHVDKFSNSLEKGLETVIGERGIKLSGGQRQRVSIARAILANPRILILDEATSNLDTESEMYIQESLTELMRSRTTIVIAHRLSTIRKADQILVIEEGKIVEQGTHDELINKRGRYFKLYTYQARI